eukprot:6210979-Pleurochrysis_carterae.AAC.2
MRPSASGVKNWAPPPRMTSAVRLIAYCSAIEYSRLRCRACVVKEAGVASVTEDVTATPVTMPARLPASKRVPQGCRLTGSTATMWLLVLRPQAHAVAPAAESVTSDDAE